MTMTAGNLTARRVMTTRVLAVTEDMTIRELADFLVENDISGAVVRDREGKPAGVVTSTDLAAHADDAERLRRRPTQPNYFTRGWDEITEASEAVGWQIEKVDLLVRDIMNPMVISIDEETPLPEVAQEMLDNRIHRILVTRGESLVGIISSSDFLRLYATEAVTATA